MSVIVFYFCNFLFFDLPPWNERNTPTYTLHPGRASSPSSLPLLRAAISWLLCPMTKWQLPKAKTPTLSLFFDASWFGIPTKKTSCGECKPATRCLQQTCGDLRLHDLGPWQMFPWRYRAKPMGVGIGQVVHLVFVCCVLCVCDVLNLSFFWDYPVEFLLCHTRWMGRIKQKNHALQCNLSCSNTSLKTEVCNNVPHWGWGKSHLQAIQRFASLYH